MNEIPFNQEGSLIKEWGGSLITLLGAFQINATKDHKETENLSAGPAFKELQEAGDTRWYYLPSDELFPSAWPLTRSEHHKDVEGAARIGRW